MLKVEKIKKEYFDTLFDDVTFILGNNEKVGLVGLNGCGKTTLFRIIAGLESAEEGRVELVNEQVGYLEQEFFFPKEMLVGEFLENLVDDPYTEMYKVEKILGKLEALDIDHFQYINDLSEGQKMKIKLTELLIEEPTILLLDEPTNHLDIDGIIWFEEFISDFDGVCMIISHDREFLNNTVNKIFEIDEKKLNIFEGNYDDYLEGKVRYIQDRAKEYHFQEKRREQLERLIENSRKIKNGKSRGKAVRAAKRKLEKEILQNEISEYQKAEVKKFDIEGVSHRKKKIFEIKKVDFGYSKEKMLLKDASLTLFGQEKLWFYGPNGIGKTTLINLLMRKLKPLDGEVKWGENIDWTYFSQDQKHLDMGATVEDYFMKNTGITYDKSFGVLERFLFPKDFRNYKLKELSPGQRARLSFAVFAQHEYNFLILDEPTNHLDIRTKEVVEQALGDFKGAVLLISHDRYFVGSVGVDRVVTLDKSKVVERDLAL